jgi:serine/threonine protein kinase
MYRFFHPNIVRIFTYHLYPTKTTGYILMEYIEGDTIDAFLKKYPEKINDIFFQTISAFSYLESQKILHRDIRAENILIGANDQVKIIDFGFGKQIFTDGDYEKTFSLNWWCPTPKEFKSQVYNSASEVYFIGMLFKQIVTENSITFDRAEIINQMAQFDPANRFKSFKEVAAAIASKVTDISLLFTETEKETYSHFSQSVMRAMRSINGELRFHGDGDRILNDLHEVYKSNVLNDYIDNPPQIVNIFLNAPYRYSTNEPISTKTLGDFVSLLKSCTPEKFAIILANLQNRFRSVDIDLPLSISDNDIPF